MTSKTDRDLLAKILMERKPAPAAQTAPGEMARVEAQRRGPESYKSMAPTPEGGLRLKRAVGGGYDTLKDVDYEEEKRKMLGMPSGKEGVLMKLYQKVFGY